MNPDYMLAWAFVWRRTTDSEAGLELLEALESGDPKIRLMAQRLLIESGEDSMGLLESALTAGALSPDSAGPCMAEILRMRYVKASGEHKAWKDVLYADA